MDLAITVLMVLAGLSLGATMPDIDLAPPLPVKHRSFWTHGPFLPALAMWLAMSSPYWLPFWTAFLPALAIHLLKDMFPKSWSGGALIKLYPLPGNFGPFLSFLYLGAALAATFWAFSKMPFIGVVLGMLGGWYHG
jgi:hypothetical protein